ncbi:MAG: gluconate 2-dehydrogenase subunit 3 family protein [Pyrinomonadaceae bacterium]
MNNKQYPSGTVRKLLDTALVTAQTRRALQGRLEEERVVPRFFDAHSFAVLCAACARLMPRIDGINLESIAGVIDKRLADGKGNGWRYDVLSADAETYTRGLQGLNESARASFKSDFVNLDESQQDEILYGVQRGEAIGETWKPLSASRFFEELLAELTEGFYSHPLALEDIGYAGMADAKGWHNIGLNRLDPQEPRPLEKQE